MPISRTQLASLLGTYPVPELHLVGAPIPGNPRSPIRWQPTPPPLQYGIDYTFMHRDGREPVRWPNGPAITVRITRPATPDMHAALAAVVTELRALTKLNLVSGEPAPASLVPPEIPDREIHVRYLTASKLADLAGRAGLGGASRCAAGCCYVTGFAIINADLTGPDATTEQALAVLRHELAHALGLGHAARPSSLMHRQLAYGTTRYGRGDQHGLALLGARPPSSSAPAASQPDKGVAMCVTTPQPQGRRSTPGPRADSCHWVDSRQLAWCLAAPGGWLSRQAR